MKPIRASLFLILTLIFFSCDTSHSYKDMEDYSEKQTTTVSLLGNLDLNALNSQMRDIDFELAPEGKPLIEMKDKKQYEVLLIIKKGVNGSPVYVKTNWEKVSSKKNTIFFKGDIKLREGDAFSLGEDWYVMGILGGSYDKEHKSLAFKSMIVPIGKGNSAAMDIPLAFPWTKIEITKEGAGNVSVRFKPLGSMLHVRLTNNREGVDVEGTGLSILSFVFSMDGEFNLRNKFLPAINQDISQIKWGEKNNSHFMTYALDFNLKYKEAASFLVWVMPHNHEHSTKEKLFSGKFPLPLTKITLNGNVSGSQVENLQVFTSSKPVKNHAWHMVNASVHRPKIALEYMADYNLGEKGSKLFVTQHRDTDGGYYTQAEAVDLNNIPSSYHLPTQTEWAGIAPLFYTHWGASAHAVEYGTVVKRARLNEVITVHGETKIYKGEYNNSPGYDQYDPATYNKLGVCYALRFQDNTNEQLSAWRYSYETNPFSTRGGKCVVIKQCYLGPSFVGTLDDISKEEFWEMHQKEVITRFLALGGEKDPASGSVEHQGYTGFYRSATDYGVTSWIFHLTSQSANTYTPEGESNREGYFVRLFHDN